MGTFFTLIDKKFCSPLILDTFAILHTQLLFLLSQMNLNISEEDDACSTVELPQKWYMGIWAGNAVPEQVHTVSIETGLRQGDFGKATS